MSNLISVIIPIYNTEQYLRRCIESVCNQTYKNLEIILVNDGSTDNSIDICKAFAKIDHRIKLINQNNKGLSIARNIGLDNSTGEIISFVDSDDYIGQTMLEKMYYLMNKFDLDVVEIEQSSDSVNSIFDHSFKIEDSITATKRILKTSAFQVWKRIYKKSLISDLRFIPNIIIEDVFFTIDLINKISSLGYLNSPLYIYNTDNISIIRSKYSEQKRDMAIKAIEYIKNHVKKDESLKKELDTHIVNHYTDQYFLISRNTFLDKGGSHREKLKKDIKNSLGISNITFRTFLVIALPQFLMAIISTTFQSLKKKLRLKNV